MYTKGWHVAGASVQGTSHRERGVPCQDAHLCSALPSGELLIAVADGAGSAPRAEEGAGLAVQYAILSLEVALRDEPPADEVAWRALMMQPFADAREAIARHATQSQTPLRDFATTLACAVLTRDRLVVGQIGDGVAVARDAGGNLLLVAQPQRGEYANEAYFLTLPDVADHVEIRIFDMVAHTLAMSTDGLLRLALRLPACEPHAPFFGPLFAFIAAASDETLAAQQLADFLASPRVCARTDDDKTLVLAVRLPPEDRSAA
jgi:hypothetical protein